MQPVIVKIIDAAEFKLLCEDRLKTLLFLYHEHRHLVRNRVAFSRITLGNRFSESYFTVFVIVDISGIKVREAGRYIFIDEFFDSV